MTFTGYEFIIFWTLFYGTCVFISFLFSYLTSNNDKFVYTYQNVDIR